MKEIWSQFGTDQCGPMKNKPRIVIVQACRGTDVNAVDQADSGDTPQYGSKGNSQKAVAKLLDYAVINAAVARCLAYRNTKLGSYMIQQFCSILESDPI